VCQVKSVKNLFGFKRKRGKEDRAIRWGKTQPKPGFVRCSKGEEAKERQRRLSTGREWQLCLPRKGEEKKGGGG